MDDMLKFYFKLLIFQTILYASLYFVVYGDSLTSDGKVVWVPIVVLGYCASVLFTFIIPVIKHIKNKKNDL